MREVFALVSRERGWAEVILKALGLSVGEIHVTLERTEYARGDRIKGELRLSLTEEVEAKRLVVGVRAKQRAIGISPSSQRGMSVSYSNDKAFEFFKELSGERTYLDGETAKFELLMPTDGTRPTIKMPEGVLGDLTSVIAALASVHRYPLEWRVFAFLDRPWALNPKGEAQFQLIEPQQEPAPAPEKKKRAAPRKKKVEKTIGPKPRKKKAQRTAE